MCAIISILGKRRGQVKDEMEPMSPILLLISLGINKTRSLGFLHDYEFKSLPFIKRDRLYILRSSGDARGA